MQLGAGTNGIQALTPRPRIFDRPKSVSGDAIVRFGRRISSPGGACGWRHFSCRFGSVRRQELAAKGRLKSPTR